MEALPVAADRPMTPSEEVSIASSVIPYAWDDSKSLYLGYRACGFSVREALNALQLSHSLLTKWRKDGEFKSLELRVPEFRQTLAKQYINIETMRNYRLIMQRDLNIISKALKADAGQDEPLTRQEQQYLIAMRKQYTPTQIDILESLITGKDKHKSGFNFAEAVNDFMQGSRGQGVSFTRTDTVRVGNE